MGGSFENILPKVKNDQIWTIAVTSLEDDFVQRQADEEIERFLKSECTGGFKWKRQMNFI